MIRSHTILLIWTLITGYRSDAQILTIDSCYALTTKNYPLVKHYALIEKSKEYTLSNASKAYLPQLSITAIEGYVFGGLPTSGAPGSESSDFKFIGIGQLSQTIWDGGATKTQKNIINASAEAEKASIDVQLNELRSRVNHLFFGVLLVNEQLNQLEEQQKILTNNINRLKQLNENGLAYKTEVDEIRVEHLKLQQHKAELKYTRSGYITMLSFLIGIQLTDQVKFQKPTENNQDDIVLKRPELLLYKNQRALLNAQADLHRVSLMPKLGLLGAGVVFAPGIALGPTELSSLGVVGLNASWNIMGLYRNSNQKKLTEQEILKVDVREEVFLFNTKMQMKQASANIEKQKAILVEDEQIVVLRQSIREGHQTKYETGAGPLIDFLNATEKEGDARAQKALHDMQLLMTLYEYKTITGN